MRIAYVIAWRGGSRTGPFKKIREQAGAWSDVGHEVALFVATSRSAATDWEALPQAHLIEGIDGSTRATILARRRLQAAVAMWQPDVIYLRHGLPSPGLSGLVARFPTVIEVNGDDVAIAASSSRLKALWARLFRGRVLRRVDGAVFMTTELASHARFASYRIDSVVVPNGIDLDRITPLAPNSDERPRLALLGHPHSPWHGTDKLLDLAHRHPDWDIEVIGPVEADLGAPPPPNLRLHPELAEADYLPLLAKVDVGIGSLAMHRIGSTENPALKVREYLARGLAVLTGCRDPDFPASTTFLLELPNVEANLRENDDAVTDFVHEWHGRRVDRTSVEHLDLRRKETQRLEFIHRVAAASGKRREKMVT